MADLPVLNPDAAYALWATNYPPYAHNPLMRAEERAMLSVLPASLEGRSILDAGCGSGRYLVHARSRGAQLLIGVDLSEPMLQRARTDVLQGHSDVVENHAYLYEGTRIEYRQPVGLACATLDALPVRSEWADITLCGLAIGHMESLDRSLLELHRVTRSGGLILCSDVHPIGKTMGWPRDFKANGHRYAVRHTWHEIQDWHHASRAIGLHVEEVLEARLDPSDIPPGARFDRQGLHVPVALIVAMRKF